MQQTPHITSHNAHIDCGGRVLTEQHGVPVRLFFSLSVGNRLADAASPTGTELRSRSCHLRPQRRFAAGTGRPTRAGEEKRGRPRRNSSPFPRQRVAGVGRLLSPPGRKSFEIWRAIPWASVRETLRHVRLLLDWLRAKALSAGAGAAPPGFALG